MLPQIWIEQAARRIAKHIKKTPLSYDQKRDLYLKWENHQTTGSFKARGALNKVLSLRDWERGAGLVTASAGNHGQGVALAGQLVGAPVTVFVSEHTLPLKLAAMRKLGAQIKIVPGGYGEAEQAGKEHTRSHNSTWISAYNDGQVIAGQGTIGLEILQELPRQSHITWVVPVGGGGLISGIGAAVKSYSTKEPHSSPKSPMKVVGVQSEASPFMHSIFHTDTQSGVDELPSLADGLSGPIEAGSLTIPLIRQYVDDLLLVEEAEIESAVAYAWYCHGERIEGSAAVVLAAVLNGKVASRPAVVILTGGNIEPAHHRKIIEEYRTQYQ